MEEIFYYRISGLSFNVNEDHIKEIFAKIGKVVSASITKNQFGQSLGYGFFSLSGLQDKEDPILFMNEGQIDGCIVHVTEESTEKRE